VDLAHGLRTARQFVRNVFARERLPPAPPPGSGEPRRRAASGLFSIEPLAMEPERPPRRRGGVVRALFAVEALPELPPSPPRARRSRWLRWLLAPESLDPP
jgi:hypothetical protein